jgi:PAS domain S-box-containing protein
MARISKTARGQAAVPALFEELLEAIPDGVVVADSQGRITFVNRQTELMSGFSREELLGRPVETLVPPDLATVHRAHRQRYSATPTTRSMGSGLNIRLRRKEGSEFPADIALSPLKTSAGPLVVATIRDTTEQRLAQQILRESEERLAVIEDRERIGRELHDGAIQSLFAVGMGLQAAGMRAADTDLKARLDAAVKDLDRVIRDLRNYIFGLRPGLLADRSLDRALRHLAEGFQSRTDVTTVVDVDAGVAAELTGQATDLLQMATEALANVGHHARATTCRVSLRRGNGLAVLEVEDDGEGFDSKNVSGPGQGLRNFRERAAHLGGRVDIESTPGDGTTVRISIPI